MDNRNLQEKAAEIIQRRKQSAVRHRRIAALSLLVAVSTVVSLIHPAISMVKAISCDKEEHEVHTEACYATVKVCPFGSVTDQIGDEVLICGMEQGSHVHSETCYGELSVLVCETTDHEHDETCYQTKQTLLCTENDHVHSDECRHVHTEDCFQKELICGEELHVHSLACYSDPNADVESAAQWEATFRNVELTGNWSQDVPAIAATQLGYRESVKNYTVLDDGVSTKGYTRYGAWYGDSYGDWCAMFASFCLYYAGVPETAMPYEANCGSWIDALTELAAYQSADAYLPKTGDLVFFDYDRNDTVECDHVGLVTELVRSDESGETVGIKTIEGNIDNCVVTRSYALNDETILGYGILPENPEQPVTEPTTQQEETATEPTQASETTIPSEEATEQPQEYMDSDPSIYEGQLTAQELAQIDSEVALAATTWSAPALRGDTAANDAYPWTAGVYYVGQGASYDVTKTDDFQLKYQMSFRTDADIEAGKLKITIPSVLLKDRYGQEVRPSDISTPAGTPDAYTASRSTPMNFYTETRDGVEYLVFFNYKKIIAGTSCAWQIYYARQYAVDIKDGTQWSLQPHVEVTLTETAADDTGDTPETTETLQQTDLTPLTGTVNTSVMLDTVTKKAYKARSAIYTPALYTYKQISGFAGDIGEDKVDLDRYYYVVWQVSVSAGYKQAWELYLKDTPYYTDKNGKTVNGKVVAVQNATKVEGSSAYAGSYLLESFARNYKNQAHTKSAFSDSFYVVTAYPRADYVAGTEFKNKAEVILHPTDGLDKDQTKTASATYTWVDYDWDYNGNLVGAGKGGYELYPSWLDIYRYASNNGADFGNLQYTALGIVNANYLTYNWQKDADNRLRRYDYKPNTWAELTTADDYMFATVSDGASDVVGEAKELTKDDYYFSAVSIEIKNEGFDYYEDSVTGHTTDAAIAKAGGAKIDRAAYVYAMYYDSASSKQGKTNAEWVLVKKIPWDDTKDEMTYSFTKAQLAKKPYRVKVVQKTVDNTTCYIKPTITIRKTSKTFQNWIKRGATLVELRNLSSVLCRSRDMDGTISWIHDSSVGSNYQEDSAVNLKSFTNGLYGQLSMRYGFTTELTALEKISEATKSAKTKNDPVNGKFDITYSLRAYEGYRLGNSSDAALLRLYGMTTICSRNSVDFYDLLPENVQFDPSVPVRAYRVTDTQNGGVSNKQMTVTVNSSEVVPNWRNTGRTLVVFHVEYNGTNASAVETETIKYEGKDLQVYNWFTGYQVTFGAYIRWEDVDSGIEEANICAYMPAVGDKNPLIAAEGMAAKDDGVIVPKSLASTCAPFTAVGSDGKRGDLNGDGVRNIQNVFYAQSAAFEDQGISSTSGIVKEAHGADDIFGTYSDSAIAATGGAYSYRITVRNPDVYPLTELVVFDHLENAIFDRVGDSDPMNFDAFGWHGTFAGLDLSYAERLGVKPVVYYSTDINAPLPAQGESADSVLLASNGWYEASAFLAAGNRLSDVKSLAVDLRRMTDGTDFSLSINDETDNVYIELNMIAPEEEQQDADGNAIRFAYNNPVYAAKQQNVLNTNEGNAVRVRLSAGHVFTVEKQVTNAPESRAEQSFRFTVYCETADEKQPYSHKDYDLFEYNQATGQWEQVIGSVFSTDASGKLSLKAGQRAVFDGGGKELLSAEEDTPALSWRVSSERSEQNGMTVHVFTNDWRPLLYLQKGLAGVPKTADVSNDTFTFRIYAENDGVWTPLSDEPYYYVKGVPVADVSPTLAVSGDFRTDANGCVTLRTGEIIAVSPGHTGTKYRIEEGRWENGEWLCADADGWMTDDTSWKAENATVTGTLTSGVNTVRVVNDYRWKELRLTKELERQAPESCEEEFGFALYELRDSQRIPVSGLTWYLKDENGEAVCDKDGNPITGVTDENGMFRAACAGRILTVFGLDAFKSYVVAETEAGEDYRLVSSEEISVRFNGVLRITGKDVSFTNKYLNRDLSVTKQVVYDPETTTLASDKTFEMLLEREEADGTYTVVANRTYTLREASGAETEKRTNAQGKFSLANGQTAIFREIAHEGTTFRVTETQDTAYPQLLPADAAPLTLVMTDDGADGRIINGTEGMVVIRKQWIGDDDYAKQWLADPTNEADLGLRLLVELDRGDGEYAAVKSTDRCGCILVHSDGTYTKAALKSGIIEYEHPSQELLVLYSSHPDWLTWSFRVTETALNAATGTDHLSALFLSADKEHLMQMYAEISTDGSAIRERPSAELVNRLRSEICCWIGKYLYGQTNPEQNAPLVWRVERYTGGHWVPASGVSYIVSYDRAYVNGDTVYTTGADGEITLYPPDAEGLTPSLAVSVGFTTEVGVNLTEGNDGDLRVVEVSERTDASWGRLIAYADEYGGYQIYTAPKKAQGFVNYSKQSLIRIEKQMDDGTVGEGPFAFTVVQKLADGSTLTGSYLPYEVFWTEGDVSCGQGSTDATGKLTLLSGQYALVSVPENSRWLISERTGYPYELVSVNGNPSTSEPESAIGEIDLRNAQNTLLAGPDFNALLPSTTKTVTFGCNRDYPDVVNSAVTPVCVDVAGSNTIMLYVVSGDVYVLSDETIRANTDCSSMFENKENLLAVRGYLDTSNVTKFIQTFCGCMKLTDITALAGWDTGNAENLRTMFAQCRSLTDLTPLSDWNTSNVTDISVMFGSLYALTDLTPLSNWDTSSVTKMRMVFGTCTALTDLSGISGWDTGSVTDMSWMFQDCHVLTNIDALSGWDASSVTDMSAMFYNCDKLVSIDALSDWDTSSVTDMSAMFYSCDKLVSIDALSDWDTSSVTGMSAMFMYCRMLTNVNALSNWNTSNVINMGRMFYGCEKLVSIDALSGWDTSSVTDMSDMFYGCQKLTSIDALSGWDTSSVTDMSDMLGYCITLTSVDALSGWDTSSVTNVAGMFSYCTRLTTMEPIRNWDLSKVTDMSRMFRNCTALTTIYVDKWGVSTALTDLRCTFDGCKKLTKLSGLAKWNVSNVTDMSCMFMNCAGLTGFGALAGWDVGKVTTMEWMFYGCSGFTSVTPFTNWTVTSLTDTALMFYGCSGVTTMEPIRNWNLSKVTDMSGMFRNCTALTTIYVDQWGVSTALTNLSGTFNGCEKLTKLSGLAKWNVSNVTDMSYMFRDCAGLTGFSALANWDVRKVTTMKYMFYGCSAFSSLTPFKNWNITSVKDMSYMFYGCTNVTDRSPISGWNLANVNTTHMFN